MIVTRDNASEYEINRFTAFASDLGFRPGEWPHRLQTDLGNGQMFVVVSNEVRDGDLLCADYAQNLGCIRLRVFND